MKLLFSALEGGGKPKQRGFAKGFEGYPSKLSDAILDVAEPLLVHLRPMTALQAERVATLAALAWNAELAARLSDDERAVVEHALAEASDEIKALIALARERKRTRHHDDDRLVLGVEVSGAPPEFRFRAAGTSLRESQLDPQEVVPMAAIEPPPISVPLIPSVAGPLAKPAPPPRPAGRSPSKPPPLPKKK